MHEWVELIPLNLSNFTAIAENSRGFYTVTFAYSYIAKIWDVTNEKDAGMGLSIQATKNFSEWK